MEKEIELGKILEPKLPAEKYETKIVNNKEDALLLIGEKKWDLVLLDIVIPEPNGMDILKQLRMSDTETPVILLTEEHLQNEIKGIDSWVNDYVMKPVKEDVLLAQINAYLHKQTQTNSESDHLQLEDLSVDMNKRKVTRDGTHIPLTPREFDLLVYLLKNEPPLMTREEMIAHVWGTDAISDQTEVDAYMQTLGQKIDTGFATSYIETLYPNLSYQEKLVESSAKNKLDIIDVEEGHTSQIGDSSQMRSAENEEAPPQKEIEAEENQADEANNENRAVILAIKAVEIALQKFPGTVTDVELEKEDEQLLYEIKIKSNHKKAKFKINADTGDILTFKAKKADEKIDYENNTLIGIIKAIEIAEQQFTGTVIEAELEEKYGKYFYEVEMKENEKEAEMEIDANTGELLEINIKNKE